MTTDNLPAVTSSGLPPVERLDIYALMSRPPKELSREDRLLICEELRRRRHAYLTGVQDKPARAKAAAPKVTSADKAANTANLLEDL